MPHRLRELLKHRILVLDGGMGTMIQQYKLTEADYRGEILKNSPFQQKGNNDLLCLTRPDIIRGIHEKYLQAGADIIETCTFNSQSISMQDYGIENKIRELNLAAAKIARSVADAYSRSNPDKPRFVAGSVGPTNKTASISPDVNNPAQRGVTFRQLENAYLEQMEALIEGGVDALLIETIFDTLNAKAALIAAKKAMEKTGRKVELMLSATVADVSGRTLSGQTIGAFLASVSHVDLLSVGLNCSFGAKDLKPYLQEISALAPWFVSAYPNAGLPNQFGEYDETPEIMASQVKEYIDEQLVNIIGGCCGTTPAHIAAYQRLIENNTGIRQPKPKSHDMRLSGLELLEIKSLAPVLPVDGQQRSLFVNIGERCNVAGSKKFLRLISEKKYEEALSIAYQQVTDGAQVIDINMDDAMLDAKEEMVNFLNLIASEPEIARLPVMIDSSKWEVIEAGLQCIQGKSIVNSISLKEGEEPFLEKAQKIREYGAAVVVMAFDEKGQADSFERKIEICGRAYHLLVTKAGFPAEDIIFDPNVLAIATGMEEHNNYGLDFINATRWIRENLPYAKISGGISNLSFSFRGNNAVREAMHAVFLYHAIRAGLDMGIVNAGMLQIYEDIPEDLLIHVEDVVLNRRPDATERMIEFAEKIKHQKSENKEENQIEWRTRSLAERLKYALVKGVSDFLEEDLAEARTVYPNVTEIIEKPLMDGMNTVGELFGSGKMFLPQVVKTARTMKKAVSILQPFLEEQQQSGSSKAGKVLIATVKGDVHDIGKNIVSVILACNNFEVIDLGVMVPSEQIIQTAIHEKVDIVCLSGLITPSLEEMRHVAEEMQKANMQLPLLIGGATTSKIHTAVKIAPYYSGAVIHIKDASLNTYAAIQLMNPVNREVLINKTKQEQEDLRKQQEQKTEKIISLEEARKKKPDLF